MKSRLNFKEFGLIIVVLSSLLHSTAASLTHYTLFPNAHYDYGCEASNGNQICFMELMTYNKIIDDVKSTRIWVRPSDNQHFNVLHYKDSNQWSDKSNATIEVCNELLSNYDDQTDYCGYRLRVKRKQLNNEDWILWNKMMEFTAKTYEEPKCEKIITKSCGLLSTLFQVMLQPIK